MQAIQLPQATDMNILKATMRVAQVSRPGGPLELVERRIPDPGPGSVRIKVQACGVCHSDVFTKEGQWPGITFPRVPGHEVVGVIDAVGKDVSGRWQAGQNMSDSLVGILLAIPNVRLRVALSMQGASHESPGPHFPNARR